MVPFTARIGRRKTRKRDTTPGITRYLAVMRWKRRLRAAENRHRTKPPAQYLRNWRQYGLIHRRVEASESWHGNHKIIIAFLKSQTDAIAGELIVEER